jgi:deoxycytidylate deaminase
MEDTKRPTFEKIFMDLAIQLSSRSTCGRAQVGCVITSDSYSQVYGIGYNGNYKGGPNQCDSDEPGNCGCFPPNVKVETKEGRVPIQDIKIGDLVLTHQGRYRKVKEVLKKDSYNGKYILINSGNTRGNKGRFISTQEHPLLVERFGEISWIRADQVVAGDTIFFKSKKCEKCDMLVPDFRMQCNKCSKESSKSKEWRKRASDRMKKDNPMKRIIKKEILNNKAVESLVAKQKEGLKNLEKELFQHIKDYKLDEKYRAIVVDHTKVKPDIILIDWENKKVIAYEYEKTLRGKREDKYKNNTQYDDVIWFIKNKKQDEMEPYNGFCRVKVTNTEEVERSGPIYNLEVEEDNSYVCQKIVVHNCLHAEDNAILKVNVSSDVPKFMFVTTVPCKICAKRIINKGGFKKVYFLKDYRCQEGRKLLESQGIEVIKYE